MEGLMEYTHAWSIYVAAGLVALWCWGRMAFWVKHYGLGYHLFSAVGAVLIFTPVPVDVMSSDYLAPGFLAVALAYLGHDQALLGYYGVWYLVTLVIALVVVAAAAAAGLMPSRPRKAPAKSAEHNAAGSGNRSSNPVDKRSNVRREPKF